MERIMSASDVQWHYDNFIEVDLDLFEAFCRGRCEHVPHLRETMEKIVGHQLRDYGHACRVAVERYQIAFQQALRAVESLQASRKRFGNAKGILDPVRGNRVVMFDALLERRAQERLLIHASAALQYRVASDLLRVAQDRLDLAIKELTPLANMTGDFQMHTMIRHNLLCGFYLWNHGWTLTIENSHEKSFAAGLRPLVEPLLDLWNRYVSTL
jgi:hypothetical protein